MGKQEFLNTLRLQLQGSLTEAEIEGHLHYYNEYISEAVASGRSLDEVMEELGSPVLIARTLIDSADMAGEERIYREESFGEQEERSYRKHITLPGWAIAAIVLLILFLLLSLVGKMIALAARFFVPLMAIVFIIAIIKSRRES